MKIIKAFEKFSGKIKEDQVHYRESLAVEGEPAALMAEAIRPTQGRRFNGRPAVSKTASGGSNPSAPARFSNFG